MNSKEIFGRNLRNRLILTNKKQVNLAHYLKVTPTTVNRWVKGEAMPRATMVDRICKYLECTTEDLMVDHSKTALLMPQDILAEEIENNPRLMRLMFYYMKLSDDELDKEIERIVK